MRNKNLLMLGCSSKQFEYAKYFFKNSIKLTIVDKSFLNFNDIKFNHIQYSYDKTEIIIKKLNDINFTPDIIFSAADQISLIYCCDISDRLQLKFRLKKNIVEMINSKFKYYKFFTENGLNIPQTEYYYDKKTLFTSLRNRLESGQTFYVKSDYSKNPRYVYKIENIKQLEKVNWKKDRYLKEGYVSQPLIGGECYRVNLFNDKAIIFNFITSKKLQQYPVDLKNFIDKLKSFVSLCGLKHEVVKFDVVYNEKDGANLLDIGLDPPLRLREYCKKKNLPFVEAYCELSLGNPEKMNILFENAI